MPKAMMIMMVINIDEGVRKFFTGGQVPNLPLISALHVASCGATKAGTFDFRVPGN
jgi:hypothetical protein